MTLIELEAVEKTVRRIDDTPLTILRNVNLQVSEGDTVSIVGRSGSGKSTLLNIMGMLDSPTSGSHRVEGRDVVSMGSAPRDRLRGETVGFVFQQFNLIAGRTALENVMVPLLYAKGSDFWRRRSIAADMLERVGLGHRVDSLPSKLSGGEQQRVAVARALVRRPRLILADEPTGALDLETGDQIMDLMTDVAMSSGAALVTITHDPAVAERAARRFVLIEGQLMSEDEMQPTVQRQPVLTSAITSDPLPSPSVAGAGAGDSDVNGSDIGETAEFRGAPSASATVSEQNGEGNA